MTVEVLFEYHGYRSIICIHKSKLCQEVERHLETSGADYNPRVVTLSLSPQDASSGKFIFCKDGTLNRDRLITLNHWMISKKDRLSTVKALSDPEVSAKAS